MILIVLSPAVMGIDPPTAATRHLIQAAPIFPLDNPAIVSVPLGFLAAVIGALLTRERLDAAAQRPGEYGKASPLIVLEVRCS